MNTLSDIITYIRRIIKTPSNQVITDALLIDYINRFWLMDMDARLQLFDLKTTYTFQTTPGIDKYNMPLYSVQNASGSYPISYYPVYQGFMMPLEIDGINCPLYTQTSSFYNLWPRYVQQAVQVGTGNGTNGPYTLQSPFFPVLTGHVDMAGVIGYANTFGLADPILISNTQIANMSASTPVLVFDKIPVTSVSSAIYFTATGGNGQNIIVADSGTFLQSSTGGDLYGLLMEPGNAPYGNSELINGPAPYYSTTQNTINYATGLAQNVYFNESIPDGTPINAQCFFIAQGIPRAGLFYNNTLTITPPPYTQLRVSLEAYLTPAAFLNTSDSIPFAYMAEYIARGAARKILSDTGDMEQLNFYEPLFREQETLVWKRSQRIWTSTRTETIFSNTGFHQNNQSSLGV